MKAISALFLGIFWMVNLQSSVAQSVYTEVDSIQIVRYRGMYPSLPPPPPPPPPDSEKVKNEPSVSEEDRYNEIYPNHDPARDMKFPLRYQTVMDEEGKYHPSIDWSSLHTFTGEQKDYIVAILNCEIGARSIEVSEGVFETTIDIGAACYMPRHGVFYWRNGEVLTYYSICLECGNHKEKTSRNFVSCISTSRLQESLEEIGF